MPWAASILIDADHYLWFCARQRSVDPRAAVRYFNTADAPSHAATRVLHSPLALLAVAVFGVRRRAMLLIAAGMALHVVLDMRHEARMAGARAGALERDAHSCRRCGSAGVPVHAHVWQQPWLLPSYGKHNLITLCASCHEAAHAQGAT